MNQTKKLVLMALYLTMALILGYVETLIPMPIPIPGIKLGLPNIIILLSLYTFDLKESFVIMCARVFLSGFLFGSMSSILYALAGGTISFLGMAIAVKKSKLSTVIISVIGAACHNFGQVIVAALVVWNLNLFLYYFPILLILSIPTGLITGILLTLLMRYLSSTPYFEMINKKTEP